MIRPRSQKSFLRTRILLLLLLPLSIAAFAQNEVSYKRGATQLEDILPPSPEAANPVYDFDGNFLGTTIEGFTGTVIIYLGKKNFSNMTALDLLYDETFDIVAQHGEARSYDSVRDELSGRAKSKI